MTRIHPQPPYYPIGTADYSSLDNYLRYPSIRDIIITMGMGLHTGCNDVCLGDTPTQLLIKLHDLQTLSRDQMMSKYSIRTPSYGTSWSIDAVLHEFQTTRLHHTNQQLLDHIHKVTHYPLRTQYTYYTYPTQLLSSPQYPVMRHLITIPNNPTILLSKYTQRTQQAHSPFITTNLPLHSSIAFGTGAGAYCVPFYLDNRTLDTTHHTPNITPSFITTLEAKYGAKIDPPLILYYIYSILWHKPYRTKYCPLLRLDYPRIPIVKSFHDFTTLANLGKQLATLHLDPPEPN